MCLSVLLLCLWALFLQVSLRTKCFGLHIWGWLHWHRVNCLVCLCVWHRAVCKKFGLHVGRLMLAFLVLSTGMFCSSAGWSNSFTWLIHSRLCCHFLPVLLIFMRYWLWCLTLVYLSNLPPSQPSSITSYRAVFFSPLCCQISTLIKNLEQNCRLDLMHVYILEGTFHVGDIFMVCMFSLFPCSCES